MAALTAAATLAIQLEQVETDIPLLVEADHTLDKLIQDNGRAQRVSDRSFRIPMESALPGSYAAISLDSNSVAFPAGGSSEWQVGTMQPVTACVPIEWTFLASLVDKSPTAVVNAVDHQLAKATDRLRQARDMMLCSGDGTGKLATVTAINGTTLTVDDTTYGARLIDKNQFVQVFSNADVLRPSGNSYGSSVQVLHVVKQLGQAHTITLDTVPAGTVVGDYIMVDGVASGSPQFIHGIESYLSNATTGTTLGLNRSTSDYVVANGVDSQGAAVSLPLLRLPLNQIVNALGEDVIKPGSMVIHTHQAQVAAYEELGEQLTMIPLNGGQADGLDLLFRGKKSVDGHPIVQNIHAHIARWDYMVLKAWGKVQYGSGQFWYTNPDGKKVFEVYGSNGSPTSASRSFLVDTTDYYVDNARAQSSIYNAATPTGYAV